MTRFCTNCGTMLTEDSAFCMKCGTPIPKETDSSPSFEKVPEEPIEKNAPAEAVFEEEKTDITDEEKTFTNEATIEEPIKEEAFPKKEEAPAFEAPRQTQVPPYTQEPFGTQAPPKWQAPPQNPVPPFVAPPAAPKEEAAKAENPKAVGPWAFFGLMVLFCIPVIGLIAYIVLAFVPVNENIKNFARANLIGLMFALIFLLLLVIAFILLQDILLEALSDLLDTNIRDLDDLFKEFSRLLK